MAVTADEYGPFDDGPGSTVNEAQWGRIMGSFLTDGVSPNILDLLEVTEDSPVGMNVRVAAGQAFVQGHQGRWESVNELTVANNSSGSTRYDSVVVRMNRTSNVVELDIVQGSAASASADPTLTQNATIWEIEIARITVANGATTIATAQIGDRRGYAGSPTSLSDICVVSSTGAHGTLQSTSPGSSLSLSLTWSNPLGAVDYFDAGNPERFTVQESGLYSVSCYVAFISPVANYSNATRRLQFFVKNAAGVVQADKSLSAGFAEHGGPWNGTISGGASEYNRIAGVTVMDPGDYIYVEASQNSGANWTASFGGLIISRLGAIDAVRRFF